MILKKTCFGIYYLLFQYLLPDDEFRENIVKKHTLTFYLYTFMQIVLHYIVNFSWFLRSTSHFSQVPIFILFSCFSFQNIIFRPFILILLATELILINLDPIILFLFQSNFFGKISQRMSRVKRTYIVGGRSVTTSCRTYEYYITKFINVDEICDGFNLSSRSIC